jgi:hypothetical protein
MFVPASRRSLVRTGFLYNARTDGRKASLGIPALRTDAPLAYPDAPLVYQATTMPVEIGLTRANPSGQAPDRSRSSRPIHVPDVL